MYARVKSAALFGVDGRVLKVTAVAEPGLPGFEQRGMHGQCLGRRAERVWSGVTASRRPRRGRRSPSPWRRTGRGPKVRAAVLAATLAELTENGYAALTVDNVARRSGVHKTTIYRRWKDREGLVADAVADRAGTAKMPFPDTGDIGTDLLRLARMTVAFLTSPAGGTVAVASMSDAGRIPEVAARAGALRSDPA